jgi:hypothetical protein
MNMRDSFLHWVIAIILGSLFVGFIYDRDKFAERVGGTLGATVAHYEVSFAFTRERLFREQREREMTR